MPREREARETRGRFALVVALQFALHTAQASVVHAKCLCAFSSAFHWLLISTFDWRDFRNVWLATDELWVLRDNCCLRSRQASPFYLYLFKIELSDQLFLNNLYLLCFSILESLACPQGYQCGSRGTCLVDPLLPQNPKCRCEKGYSYAKDGKCVGKLQPYHLKT